MSENKITSNGILLARCLQGATENDDLVVESRLVILLDK